MNILNLIDQALSTPQESGGAIATSPRVSVRWELAAALLKFCNLPTDGTRSKLDSHALQWAAELDGLKGYSCNDVKPEYLAALRAAVSKNDKRKIPTREEISQRNSDVRRVCRLRAALVGKEACAIAAETLEQAAKKIPAFRKHILDQESALFPAGIGELGKSPLAALLDELPAFVQVHIEKLRTHPGMVNPATLLK